MKKLFFFTLAALFSTAQAQYSTYYYNVDVNRRVNTNINKNVNVSGNVYEHKTITTIDYGALAAANAQREKNRLEAMIYADEQQRRISLEVASNPIKAYDYGTQTTFIIKGKGAKPHGLRSFTLSYIAPHKSIFVGGAGRLENIDPDGVITEITFGGPLYNKEKDEIDMEKEAKMEGVTVGEIHEELDGSKIFVHKKEISRATVHGLRGFKSTLIWEDDYEYTIEDNFLSHDPSKKNGIQYLVRVRTYGNKNEIDFEDLEGRRYYLRPLIEKIISNALVNNIKY